MTIPENVTTIQYGTFNWCESLKEVVIPDSVTSIESYAFGACFNLEKINLPEGLKTIESHAFEGCKSLSGEIVFPESLEHIGKDALESTNFDKITVLNPELSLFDTHYHRPDGLEIYRPDSETQECTEK